LGINPPRTRPINKHEWYNAIMSNEVTLDSWLESLSAKQPTPGGGAVAALSAALAAALIGMVSIYTTGEKWPDRTEKMQDIHDTAARFRQEALQLIEADAVAFRQVGAAYGLPRETAADKTARSQAIQEALLAAAQPPIQTALLAESLLNLTNELSRSGNPNVISDVAVAASNIRASLEAAIVNIEINERLINDPDAKAGLKQAVAQASALLKKTDDIVKTVRQEMGA
jgi:formiminotetrahydrofolate cyclodeaminase